MTVKIFEQFIKEGKYLAIKQREHFLEEAKSFLKCEFENLPGKRHVFKDINMVVKFVTKEIRNTNHHGLITELFDYVKPEMALPLLSLDKKKLKAENKDELAAPFLLPTTYYIKPTLNKKGKAFVQKVDTLFGGQTYEELLFEINEVSTELTLLQNEYEEMKAELEKIVELTEKKKLKTSVGSISYLTHEPKWEMEPLMDVLGENFVINYGKVDMTLIDEWVLTGVIPKSIVTKNRTVIDLRLDFMVMPLDTESRIINFHNKKRTKLSLRRYA